MGLPTELIRRLRPSTATVPSTIVPSSSSEISETSAGRAEARSVATAGAASKYSVAGGVSHGCLGTAVAPARFETCKSYVASRVCNVDCQYLSKLCPPSPPRRVMCIDDGRRLSSLRKGWYLLLGDLVPCVFISSSIDQLRLDWTRSVLSGPRFSLPVTALPSSCSGAKAVCACH